MKKCIFVYFRNIQQFHMSRAANHLIPVKVSIHLSCELNKFMLLFKLQFQSFLVRFDRNDHEYITFTKYR